MEDGYCENNKLQCLLWIVSHAIAVEYEDNCNFMGLVIIINFVVEKYNNINQDLAVSNEDMEILQSFKSELLKIATSLNLSIVDENDIQLTINVCFGFLNHLKIIDEELKSMKSQIVNGKIAPLPFSLEELPITMSTNSSFSLLSRLTHRS